MCVCTQAYMSQCSCGGHRAPPRNQSVVGLLGQMPLPIELFLLGSVLYHFCKPHFFSLESLWWWWIQNGLQGKRTVTTPLLRAMWGNLHYFLVLVIFPTHSFFFIYIFKNTNLHIHTHTHIIVYMWMSWDNFWELVFSFYRVYFRNWTQFLSSGSQHPPQWTALPALHSETPVGSLELMWLGTHPWWGCREQCIWR